MVSVIYPFQKACSGVLVPRKPAVTPKLSLRRGALLSRALLMVAHNPRRVLPLSLDSHHRRATCKAPRAQRLIAKLHRCPARVGLIAQGLLIWYPSRFYKAPSLYEGIQLMSKPCVGSALEKHPPTRGSTEERDRGHCL
jgi:hypothetical protein